MSAVYLSIHPSVFSRSQAAPTGFLRSSLPPFLVLVVAQVGRRTSLARSLLLDDPAMAAAAPFGRWFRSSEMESGTFPVSCMQQEAMMAGAAAPLTR